MRTTEELLEGDLFMMCWALRPSALSALPEGYHFRLCRRDELELWMKMQFDTDALAAEYLPFMQDYFSRVYARDEARFFAQCLFVCDESDFPVGCCFTWKAYGSVSTVHWFKVRRCCEGKEIGRALLSRVLAALPNTEYPVFLHTHPASFRAIKLYSDMGFALLTDDTVGFRSNDLQESLPVLRRHIPPAVYEGLKFSAAPPDFLAAVRQSEFAEL